MKILSIQYKNIFSFGEQIQEINYTDTGKLILLKGQSGSGKSTILSLPCLLLYGKLEKIPKTSYANRINKNGWIKGEIIQNGHNYIIERSFSPNSITVYKDNVNIENYGSKDAQAYIDNEIIDIPLATFSNMISISMKKFKSFLTMSPADRKQIIDRVFNIEIINIVFENIKKDMREIGNSINGYNSTLFSLNQNLQSSNNELAKIQEKLKSEENQSKIEENKKIIKDNNDKLQKLQDNYNKIVNQQNQLNIQIQNYKKQQIENNVNINNINDKILLFQQDKCPTCGTSFTSDWFNELRQQLNILLQQKEEIKKQLEDKLTELNNNINLTKDYLTKINNAAYQIQQQNIKLNSENFVIQEKINQSGEFQAIQNIINMTVNQIKEVKNNIEEKNQQMLDLQNLLVVYSIDGVKQKVINNYLPLFNKEIEQNLLLLNISYGLEFDSKFDPHLKDLGIELDPSSLSDGETTRVDIVVLCSLFKLLKRRYPTINILNMDETISTLDNQTSGVVLEFLKNFAKDNKLNCFIVSHTDLYLENFDEIIEIERYNGFSRLTKNLISI